MPSEGSGWSLRVGRQELALGSQRLVSVREGTNVRRRFDGVRVDLHDARGRVTLVAAHLTENEVGSFDDGTDRDVALWGIHAALNAPLGAPTDVDLHLLGFRDDDAIYAQGRGRELRHSVGVRLHGARRGWDWNVEALGQWGRFDGADIRAWSAASEVGYRFEARRFAPRVALSANVASGDDDPDDRDLGTFNPLFPRGNYFSHLALLGPRNFVNLNPKLELQLTRRLVVAADLNLYWRLETGDALYGPSGNLLRRGSETGSRFVGPAFSASIDWTPNPFVAVGLVYTRGFAGPFIEDTGPARDIDFVEWTLRWRF